MTSNRTAGEPRGCSKASRRGREGREGAFIREKKEQLEKSDCSRKGSIDESVRELVRLLNESPSYYTTSSCSGRLIVVSQEEEEEVADMDTPMQKKRGCRWLFVSHARADPEDVVRSLDGVTDSALFKFEPFILHVCCEDLEAGRALHEVALASGFKNSGLTVSRRERVMLAVRSTPSYQIPVSRRGQVLVSKDYIDYFVQKANHRMDENNARIGRFYSNLSKILSLASQTIENVNS